MCITNKDNVVTCLVSNLFSYFLISVLSKTEGWMVFIWPLSLLKRDFDMHLMLFTHSEKVSSLFFISNLNRRLHLRHL